MTLARGQGRGHSELQRRSTPCGYHVGFLPKADRGYKEKVEHPHPSPCFPDPANPTFHSTPVFQPCATYLTSIVLKHKRGRRLKLDSNHTIWAEWISSQNFSGPYDLPSTDVTVQFMRDEITSQSFVFMHQPVVKHDNENRSCCQKTIIISDDSACVVRTNHFQHNFAWSFRGGGV